MIINTKYNIGDIVSIQGGNDMWRIISIHISLYNKEASIIYDIQDEKDRKSIVNESKIKELII